MSDNPLANVDLGVIAVPKAPAGFSDIVLARFASTEAAIAVEKRRRVRRIAWFASGVVAFAAAALAVVVLWPRSSASGSYVADGPHHLDVDGLAVELEGGAAITWKAERGTVHVDQRGAATWTVPNGNHLRVGVAGVGTVDASNATLHVEARMNLLEKKTLGATAVTAVLVTAITATVIHGQAKVSGAGQELTLKEGQSASVATGKAPVEVLTAGEATAVEIVFSGEQRWTDHELEAMESAIDHVQLPLGSTVGAVSYSTGATLRAEATPASRFGAGWLGYTGLYRGAIGSDLVEGVTFGLAELSHSPITHKVLVVVGDGNDTNNNAAKAALIDLQTTARKMGVTIRAVLAPPFTTRPSVLEAANIPTFDATKLELTHALANAMGGSAERPKAVVVVFEGRGVWASADALSAVGQGIESIDLPPASRIGVAEYSTGASMRIPLEPAENFKATQLGSAKDYASKTGSDLVSGVVLGLAELTRAPEASKVLIIVGDGHDTNDEAAPAKLRDLLQTAQQSNVRVRVVQLDSIDKLPTHALLSLDPKLAIAGGNYQSRIRVITFGITRAVDY